MEPEVFLCWLPKYIKFSSKLDPLHASAALYNRNIQIHISKHWNSWNMSVCYKKLNFKNIFRYGQICSPLGLAPPTQNSKTIQLYTPSCQKESWKTRWGRWSGGKERKKKVFIFFCLSHRETPRLYKEYETDAWHSQPAFYQLRRPG